MRDNNWKSQTVEEILDNMKKELERLLKLKMHQSYLNSLKRETKHKEFAND